MTCAAQDELLAYADGGVGRLRLNRPRALHTLTLEMCRAMAAALLLWRDDPAVAAVLLDHATGRGFCAGGDVVRIATSVGGMAAPRGPFSSTNIGSTTCCSAMPSRPLPSWTG